MESDRCKIQQVVNDIVTNAQMILLEETTSNVSLTLKMEYLVDHKYEWEAMKRKYF